MGTVEVVALLLVVAAVAMFSLALRRWWLVRGGAIDVSWRVRPGAAGRGWRLGLAKYSGDDLSWFRVFSFSPRPSRRLARRALEIVDRRAPEGQEAWTLHPGVIVLDCRNEVAAAELAMGPDSLAGFLSWLEAAPPGYTMEGYAAG